MKFLKASNLDVYSIVLMAVWTIIVVNLIVYEMISLRNKTHGIVLAQAKTSFNKDLALRKWVTSHGGVYVPIDKKTPPSKYLYNIQDRDIETPSGIKLTLMNPAYVLRQITELYSDLYGVKGHITSLKPIRPENSPDEWEKKSLTIFEQGVKEKFEFTNIDGKPFLRFMCMMITEEGCLKCHSHQGYKVGDVRGGISIAIPMENYFIQERKDFLLHLFWYLILWSFGATGIYYGARKIKQNMFERDLAYEELEKYQEQLEQIVNDRTSKLEKINQKLEYLTITDSLTGIANRRYFDTLIQKEWNRAMRESKPISLIMIDIDFFKSYNDLYGHQSGDECLKKAAMVLDIEMKRAGDFVARYGGEEFVVVLPNTNISEALAVAETLRTSVNKLQIVHAGSKINNYVSISLGVASTIPERNSLVEKFIMSADKNLYLAKKEGRNMVKFS
ncbi:diguanylate cyclase [Candidatus Desantisbacteria bacterium]|nr:diguanylate cyclase [Candidatus Desantisbacteria bacterium]